MNKEDNTKNIPGIDAQITLSGITIASQDGLMQHVNDSAVHITDEERSKWNAGAGSVAGDVVTSIGGQTGAIELGNGLELTQNSEKAPSLSLGNISELTVGKDFKLTRLIGGVSESHPIFRCTGNIESMSVEWLGAKAIWMHYCPSYFGEMHMYKTPTILREGKYWDSYLTSDNLPQSIKSSWTFTGETTRSTKASPALTDVMNREMVENLLKEHGLIS